MPQPYEKKLRLPVRLVDGVWELEFGGTIPLADGQRADLVVPEADVTDPRLVRQMKSRSEIKILDRGTKLRAYLATKELKDVSDEQRKLLLEWKNWEADLALFAIDSWSGGPVSFFELTLGPATERQSQDLIMSEGGLWLILEGRKAKGLQSSLFELPDCISEENAISLNHAFTILSEVYEPWRKSHTGNVYDRFLYQESDEKWYPLSFLRDFELAQQDQRIAYKLWQDFMARMSNSGTS